MKRRRFLKILFKSILSLPVLGAVARLGPGEYVEYDVFVVDINSKRHVSIVPVTDTDTLDRSVFSAIKNNAGIKSAKWRG